MLYYKVRSYADYKYIATKVTDNVTMNLQISCVPIERARSMHLDEQCMEGGGARAVNHELANIR